MKSGQFRGALWAMVQLVLPHKRRIIERVITDLITEGQQKPRTRTYVMMVGPTIIDKDVLFQQEPFLGSLFEISSDDIHRRLIHALPGLQEGSTREESMYWRINYLTNIVQGRVLEEIMRQGISLIQDSHRLRARAQSERLAFARRHGYITRVIWA